MSRFKKYDDGIVGPIAKGIPLDDVKAEIQTKEMVETDSEIQFYNMALDGCDADSRQHRQGK